MSLSVERAQSILEAARGKKILVVGDLMLDKYTEGTVERISPEAPVPVVLVRNERSVPGGACNVAVNLQALGAAAAVSGVVGIDAHAEELLGKLREHQVDVSRVTTDPRVSTIAKTRVVADRQQIVRIDHETGGFDEVSRSDTFTASLQSALNDADAIIIEDYGKGVIHQDVVNQVLETARHRALPVGYDPKDNHLLQVQGITLATPNRKEAFHAAGVADKPGKDAATDLAQIRAMGLKLYDLWKPEMLMLTLGASGIMLIEAGSETHRAETRAREVFDVSGAGDTVIATCLLALIGGATAIEAAEMGNFAASVVVAKLGTATCTPDELFQAIAESGV